MSGVIIVDEKIRNRLFLVFIVGLFIRLLLMPYTTHCHTWERLTAEDARFLAGFDPQLFDLGIGVSFRLFNIVSYIPYLILSSFGINYQFLLLSLFKIPSLIGDVIVFYSLYNIAFLTSNNEKKSLGVATAYFLNPFVIWIGAIVGSTDQLIAAFILLAILYLMKGKIGYSAICLSFSVFCRYFSILLLPCFLFYIWRRDRSIRPRVSHFLIAFLGASMTLSIPYLISLIHLYSSSAPAFWSLVNDYLGFTGIGGGESPNIAWMMNWKFNFTGFFASLGVWPSISPIFSLRVFAILYLIVTVIMMRRMSSSSPAHFINRYTIVVFSLFMLIIPLSQSHYLMWIFPFLLIESLLFSGLPKYYPHLLWIANMAAETIISGHFTTYPILGNYPLWWKYPWLFFNQNLTTSVSVLHGSFLLLTVITCITTVSTYAHASLKHDKIHNKVPLSSLYLHAFIPSFFVYSLLEILRIAYDIQTNYFVAFLSILAGCILTLFWFFTYKNKNLISQCDVMFQDRLSKVAALLQMMSIIALFFVITTFKLDVPSFLLAQALLLGSLLLINRNFKTGLNAQRISFIFTIIYTSYILLVTKNTLIGLITAIYLVSSLYLQVILNRSPAKSITPKIHFEAKLKRHKISEPNRHFIITLKKHRIVKFFFCCSIFIILLLLAYTPLMQAVISGSIANQRGYWPGWYVSGDNHGNLYSSNGCVVMINGSVAVSSLEYNETSWATWKVYAPRLAFMSQQLREVENARVVIEGTPRASISKVTDFEWIDDNFTSGWTIDQNGAANYSFSTDGDVVTITGVFTAGVAGSIWIWRLTPSISTTDYPYLVFRVRVNEPDSNWMVEVIYTDGTTESWGGGLGGEFFAYNTEWKIFVKKISIGKIVKAVDLRIENNRLAAWTGSGVRSAYFDYIGFTSLPEKNIQVYLNNHLIFDGTLNFSRGEFLTLPSEYESSVVIPFNFSLLEMESLLNITVNEHIIWMIKSVIISHTGSVTDVQPPAWQLIPYHNSLLLVVFVLEITVVLMMSNKFRK